MAQCPRCKGDMPLLSKICPICGYTIADEDSTNMTPMEYKEDLEELLKDFRALPMPTFWDSFKKLLAIVALLLTIYFFVMSFMTGAFLFKLLCNVSLISIFVSIGYAIYNKIKAKDEENNENNATANEIKSDFEHLVRSARQEYGKNIEMSRFLDNVTNEMLSIDDEHVTRRRSIIRNWIIIAVAFVVVFTSSTVITDFINQKAQEIAQYGVFQQQVEEYILSDANTNTGGSLERFSLVIDMLSGNDVERAKMFINEFCSGRPGDFDCSEAVVRYLVGSDKLDEAKQFIENLNLESLTDKQKLLDLLLQLASQANQ